MLNNFNDSPNHGLELGNNHKPFIKVVKGGSCCANCVFLTEDKKHCKNKLFVKWYGKDLLPQPIDEWCSDWYEPNPEYLAKGGIVTAKAPYYFRKEKKKDHIQKLAGSIKALRSQITKDLKSDDEKTKLTALVVAVIDNTAERVGNEISEEDGHFGVTGLRKKHVTVERNKVILKYVGKSGVEHEKSFSNKTVAESLNEAIATTPRRSIFVTSEGFRIKGDRINRYLSDHDITAKDLRGYHANNFIIEQLKKQEIPLTEKERKFLFKKAVRFSADKVGHKAFTLQKHYLISEVETLYIEQGEIIDLSNFYDMTNNGKDGGLLEGKTHAEGGIDAIVTDINKSVELETKEAIINANSMGMEEQFVISGTPAEIASAVNVVGGGVEFEEGASVEVLKDGGHLNENNFKTDYQEKLKTISPGHPENWYKYQSDVNWENYKSMVHGSNKKEPWKETFYEYSFTVPYHKREVARLSHSAKVKEAINKHEYATSVLNNDMTAHRAMLIIESADIPIPAEISNLAAVENHERAENNQRKLEALEAETLIKAKEIKKVFTKHDVMDTIEGLKVLSETLTGSDKLNTENTIEGLEILFETMPEIMEKGGYALYKDGNIIHETYN